VARFYAVENFPLPAVEALRVCGHDVLTSLQAGQANASVPDLAVLAFATVENRVVLTHNRPHFLRLHRETEGAHAGMCLCTFDPDFAGLAARIDAAIRAEVTGLKSKVLRVYRPG
jgi:predicted nuclease of predicted toxin-antitoxin system